MSQDEHTNPDQNDSGLHQLQHNDIDRYPHRIGFGTAAAQHFQSVATDLDLPIRDSSPQAAELDEVFAT